MFLLVCDDCLFTRKHSNNTSQNLKNTPQNSNHTTKTKTKKQKQGLEISTIILPGAFLPLGSLANMLKGLSWMAAGSTRSVFNLSFVRDNNIADITAKGTSQYIFASLFGTAAGVTLCAHVGLSAGAALTAFGALTAASLYGAFCTVKSIPLPTLNSTRLQLLANRCVVVCFCLFCLSLITQTNNLWPPLIPPSLHPHIQHTTTTLNSYLKCVESPALRAEQYAGGPDSDSGGSSSSSSASASPPRFASFLSGREYELRDDDDTCDADLPGPAALAEQDPPLPWFMGDQRILNPDIRVGTQLDHFVAGERC